jgi:hypothetical protein
LIKNDRYDEFFRIQKSLAESLSAKLDPLEGPLAEAARGIARKRASRAEINRLKGRLEHSGRMLNNSAKWYDQFAGQRTADLYKDAAESLVKQLVSSNG